MSKSIRYCFILIIILVCTNLKGFQTGEKLTFAIKYGVITAGQAVLEVSETVYHDTIDCYLIKSTSRTNSFFDTVFRVRDKIESVLDKNRFISYKFTKKLREGSYRQDRIHFYYPDQNFSLYLKYSKKQKRFKEKRMEIPSDTQDILSAFYWTRNQDLEVGESVFIHVTVDGLNCNTEIKILRKEEIKTIFGLKECLVIEPVLLGEAIFKQTGNILVWITNDEYKVPVKMESKIIFGSFKAILKDAENVPYSKK